MTQIIDNIIERIKAESNKKTLSDLILENGGEYNDYFGGNIDDAYSRGLDDGAIEFARQLLNVTTNKIG